MTSDRDRPAVSVVVPTRSAWPALKPVVDALQPQIVAAEGELVVVDGTETGEALDSAAGGVPPQFVRVIAAPGADVFELRAIGIFEAAGQIVALIEDHCVPTSDYLLAILRGHNARPEQAVAGAVTNGSAERLVDRVNFLLVHARNLPPMPTVPEPGWIPTPSNISYKRDVVPATLPERGWLETKLNVELLFASQVAVDDRIAVSHVQSTGRLGTVRNHFHAGKSMGGLARATIGNRGAQLWWGCQMTLKLPVGLVRPIWRLQGRSSAEPCSLPSLLSLAVVISAADALGFACGVVAGPGRSPHLLH